MEERVAGEERGKLGESTADSANTAEKDETAEATGSRGA
jgi:hypothetical protein